MKKIELYYRDGDVGDAEQFEASCDVFDAAGETPEKALKALAEAIAAAGEPEAVPEPAEV